MIAAMPANAVTVNMQKERMTFNKNGLILPEIIVERLNYS
jgi:hypothetical protein